ncbi:MAG: O-antigen ligase family protein [Candidatus Gastranaerophilaceae bacterium]|jgi:hypothetical protein
MIELIFEKLMNLPDKFWQRLFVVFLSYGSAQIALRILPIPFMVDESFLVAVFVTFSFIVLLLLPKIMGNPFLNYIIIQLMFFWMVLDQFLKKFAHVSIEPHAVVFGFTILSGSICFFKNFKFLWKFIIFRFLFMFFIINIIYYFCYYSDFNINSVDLTGHGGISENQPARTIIFLDSLAVFLSSVIPLSLFVTINNKIELDKVICRISKILCYCFILFILLLPLITENRIHGAQIYLSIYFIVILGFKYYVDNIENNKFTTLKFSNLMTFIIIILFGITIINCNKSASIAILMATFLFILINYKLKLKFYIFNFLKNKKYSIILSILLITFFIFLTIKFNIIGIICKSLTKTFNSVAGGGINSYYIRKSNWRLFCNYWINHLDTIKCLFGFGLGKSREIIYYITRSQYDPMYYVQTTHDQYMEMFFDYGFLALLYFIPFVLILGRNLLNLINKKISNKIKLISNMSSCLIIFYFIYHYSDGLRVPTAIIFFSALMLLEGIITKLSFGNFTSDIN